MILKIAFGTDDGISFTKEHFGDAKKYIICKFDSKSGEVGEREIRENFSVEEKMHGDPKKAASISQLLGDMEVLVGFVMGPNIMRIRKKFVPVISREINIEKSINLINKKLKEIIVEIEKIEDKRIIYLN